MSQSKKKKNVLQSNEVENELGIKSKLHRYVKSQKQYARFFFSTGRLVVVAYSFIYSSFSFLFGSSLRYFICVSWSLVCEQACVSLCCLLSNHRIFIFISQFNYYCHFETKAIAPWNLHENPHIKVRRSIVGITIIILLVVIVRI